MTQLERLELYSRNANWFFKNLDRLRSLYPDRYVAVYNQAVIDSDSDVERLEARLRKRGANLLAVSVIEYVSSKQPCMLLCA